MFRSRFELWVTAIYRGVVSGCVTAAGALLLGLLKHITSEVFVVATVGCGVEVAALVIAFHVCDESSHR